MMVNEEAVEETLNVDVDKINLSIVLTSPQDNVEVYENKLKEGGDQTTFIKIDEPLPDQKANLNYRHLKPAINYAKENNYDLVIGIDTDYNKICVATRKSVNDEFIILNIHQLAALLSYNWLKSEGDKPLMLVKSIHMTDMLENIMARSDSRFVNKVIDAGGLSDIANQVYEEQDDKGVIGFTEHQEIYHYEKDFTEILESLVAIDKNLRSDELTLFDHLIELYRFFGFYKEKVFVVEFKTENQRKHLLRTMDKLRNDPRIIESRIHIDRITDYRKGWKVNLLTQKKMKLTEPTVNVLRLDSGNDVSITLAPSENKMSYHLAMRTSISSKEFYDENSKEISDYMVKIMETINRL